MEYGSGPTIIRPAGYGGCQFAHFLYTVALTILGLRLLGRGIGWLLGDLDVWEPVGPLNTIFGILWLSGLIMAIISKKGAAEKMGDSLVNARKVGINGIISFVIIVLIAASFETFPTWLLYLIWLGGLLFQIVDEVKRSGRGRHLGDALPGYFFSGILAIISFVIISMIANSFETFSASWLYLIWWFRYIFEATEGISPYYVGKSEGLAGYSGTIDDR